MMVPALSRTVLIIVFFLAPSMLFNSLKTVCGSCHNANTEEVHGIFTVNHFEYRVEGI